MLCERCGKKPSTVMYTQIINGQKESIHICSDCAAKESIFENFGSLLSFARPLQNTMIACPNCKTTLAEFTRAGRTGCGECYKTFRTQAEEILKKIHGTSKHVCDEKPQIKEETEKSEVQILREKLNQAIEKEQFEAAAILRDKIRALEKEGKG